MESVLFTEDINNPEITMNINKFFRFAYFSGKKPLLHHQRDGESFIELMPLLISKGFEYGGLLLNLPVEDGGKSVLSDRSSFRKGDLIVMTTRPPLNDQEEGPHLVIPMGHSALEKKIFHALSKYLSICSRRQVTLHESLLDKFESGCDDKSSITFTGHGKITRYFNVARYQATVDSKKRVKQWRHKDGRKTAAYLIYTGQAWKGGPDLLVSFGMTGACNLIWAYLIQKKFPHFLENYRIVVAEMTVGDIPDIPADLSFVKDWDVKILLDHKL
jgi:hypothetical protein